MSENPIRVGVIGAGRIGRNHSEILARHSPGVTLQAIADPAPGIARRAADELGVTGAYESAGELLASDVEAVVICAPSALHGQLIVAAAAAGKAIFCEKPAAGSVAELDRALERVAVAAVPLQIGFNRRFAPGFRAARAAIESGRVGSVQLMRSNTRDPELNNPAGIPPWTIFTQTLIHDFDTLNWLNPGAEPVRVHAQAGALIRPEFAESGLLDTALVTVTYSNGAMAMADASFQAVYGYDVRAEVFGSGGRLDIGHTNSTDLVTFSADGMAVDTTRSDTELLQDSFRAELAAFTSAVRSRHVTGATGLDARRALAVAEAAIKSVQTGLSIQL